jgi:hypothetical protein
MEFHGIPWHAIPDPEDAAGEKESFVNDQGLWLGKRLSE